MDVAAVKGREWIDVEHEPFAEAVVTYMRDVQGVDFADEDWGIERDELPFTTRHVGVRKLLAFYPDCLEYLAGASPQSPPDDTLMIP